MTRPPPVRPGRLGTPSSREAFIAAVAAAAGRRRGDAGQGHLPGRDRHPGVCSRGLRDQQLWRGAHTRRRPCPRPGQSLAQAHQCGRCARALRRSTCGHFTAAPAPLALSAVQSSLAAQRALARKHAGGRPPPLPEVICGTPMLVDREPNDSRVLRPLLQAASGAFAAARSGWCRPCAPLTAASSSCTAARSCGTLG